MSNIIQNNYTYAHFTPVKPEALNDKKNQTALRHEFQVKAVREEFIQTISGPVSIIPYSNRYCSHGNDHSKVNDLIIALYDQSVGTAVFMKRLNKIKISGSALAIGNANFFLKNNMQKISSKIATNPNPSKASLSLDLPIETLTLILSYLPRKHPAGLTSKNFLMASMNRKFLDISNGKASLKDSGFKTCTSALAFAQDKKFNFLDFSGYDFSIIKFGQFKKFSSISLNLEECIFFPDAFEYFQQSCLTALNLRDISIISINNRHLHCHLADPYKFLAGLTLLTSLNLTNCEEINDEALHHLKKLPLSSLRLANCYKITDGGLVNLKELPLTFFSISGSNISGRGLTNVIDLPLTSLDLSTCPLLRDSELKNFKNLPLTSLNLSLTPISIGLTHLQKIVSLTYLDISMCNHMTDEHLLNLGHLPSLTSLNLSRCFLVTRMGVINLIETRVKMGIKSNLKVKCQQF